MKVRSFLLAGVTILSSSFFSANATYRETFGHEDEASRPLRLVTGASREQSPHMVYVLNSTRLGTALEFLDENVGSHPYVRLSSSAPLSANAFQNVGQLFSQKEGLESFELMGPRENTSLIDETKIDHLMGLLGPNSRLKTLSLTGHTLTDKAVMGLAQALRNTPFLEVLQLKDSFVGSEGLFSLMNLVLNKGNSGIKSLEISPALQSDSMVPLLREACVTNGVGFCFVSAAPYGFFSF